MVQSVNNTLPRLFLGNNYFQDEIFTTPGGTIPAGTVLARLTADSKLVPYDSAGAGGAEVPRFILADELTTAGPGDTIIRACMTGLAYTDRVTELGVGLLDKLKQDELRASGDIVLLESTELLIFDN